jgi:diadenylate cyclase
MPDFPDLLNAALQVLILSAGVYLLLGFLRTTRGSGLLRGLGVALLVGGVGLWGFAELLHLDELLHVLRTILQVAVIVLAILFHPELRRGIVSLGDNKLLGRFLQSHKREVITEIAAAVVAMAKKKQGALIAIERKTPLDAYIEGGVKIDAEVNRLLLDSLFHHGNALHDGAVIVRGDRIEAAASLFPLTENLEISKSTGTRHRAALGLTEETDAVTVTVSEENGLISICKGGKMERRVGRDALEEVLRERIGTDEDAGAAQTGEKEESGLTLLARALFIARPLDKFVALGLGFLIFLSAYNAVRTDREFDLELFVPVAGSEDDGPKAGQLVIIAAGDVRVDHELDDVRVLVRAPRDLMTSLKSGLLGGTLRLPAGETGERELTVDEISWSAGSSILEEGALSEVQWVGPAPRIELVSYSKIRLRPDPRGVRLDDAALGSRREVDAGGLKFIPTEIAVRGPKNSLDGLEQRIAFEPVTLPSLESWGGSDEWSTPVELTPDLVREGFELVGVLNLVVPARPRPEPLPSIDVEVMLVSLDPAQPDLVARFEPPREKVRLELEAVGIPLVTQGLGIELRELALEHVRVWVDVSRLDLSQGTVLEAPLVVLGVERDVWINAIPASTLVEELQNDSRAELRVTIEGETTILLTLKEQPETGGDEKSATPGGGEL